jgi:hypothetical protein
MGVVERCHAQERRALRRGSPASSEQDDVLGMLDGNNQKQKQKIHAGAFFVFSPRQLPLPLAAAVVVRTLLVQLVKVVAVACAVWARGLSRGSPPCPCLRGAWRPATNAHSQKPPNTVQHSNGLAKRDPKQTPLFASSTPLTSPAHTAHTPADTPHPAREEASPTCPTFPAFSSRSKV